MVVGYTLNFSPLLPFKHAFIHGALTTLYLSLLTVACSFVLGVPGVLLRTSSNIVARGVMRAYVDVIRNMPTLVIIYVIYFGLAGIVNLDSFLSALVALTISGLAFTIEAYRGGIQGIPPGQLEAANALSLHGWRVWRWVILPQAIRIAFPALGNLVISIVLSTALVSVVAAEDITYQANIAGAYTFRYFEAYILAAAMYVVLCLAITLAWRAIGKHLFPEYTA